MSGIKLIIARHGNTFKKDDTPTRVGCRTDLPLTEEGEEQALRLGHYLAQEQLIPNRIFTSELRRTIDTGRLICVALNCTAPHTPRIFLNEIDYGPDENQTDESVIQRVGSNVIKNWEEQSVMPDDWFPRPVEILARWKEFLNECVENYKNETVLVVTSNGIARFLLPLTENGAACPPKLKTGAYGLLEYHGDWHVKDWNIRP